MGMTANNKFGFICVLLQSILLQSVVLLLGTAQGQDVRFDVGSNVMLVGDSFTDGSTEWARRVTLSSEFSLDFFSEGGRSIRSMALLFGDQYQANTYEAVVIAGGINDVIGNRNAIQIQESIESIIAQTNGEHIILTTIAPFQGNANIWTAARQNVANEVDAWITTTAAASTNISVFDIRSILDVDNDQVIDPGVNSGDGLHPGMCPLSSQCGSSVIADAFIDQFSITLGDVSGDGEVNFQDIAAFIGVLSVGAFQDEADLDRSDDVGFLDIAPFILRLGEQ